jgi:hypothetical protein
MPALQFNLRSVMHKYFICTVLASILFFGVGSTATDARAGKASEQQLCSGDVSRLCRKFIADGDFAILGCLKQKRRSLSSGCKRVLRDNGQ